MISKFNHLHRKTVKSSHKQKKISIFRATYTENNNHKKSTKESHLGCFIEWLLAICYAVFCCPLEILPLEMVEWLMKFNALYSWNRTRNQYSCDWKAFAIYCRASRFGHLSKWARFHKMKKKKANKNAEKFDIQYAIEREPAKVNRFIFQTWHTKRNTEHIRWHNRNNNAYQPHCK